MTTTSPTVRNRSAEGKRNRGAGLRWNRECVVFLRNWWPSAERELNFHSNDITGIGDIAVETTIEPWQQIWKKVAQARHDARRRGLDFYCVWKKHNREAGAAPGSAGPGSGAILIPAEVFWPMWAELERHRAAAATRARQRKG